MAFYVNAQSLLSDARLRLDALGEASSILIVEGNDDKRLFYTRMSATSDVMPTDGKKLLRLALESIRESDKGHILFVTDCDYDVPAGDLHGGPDVIITTSCDVESDLIALGILDKVAVEVVPHAIASKGSAEKIGTDVREHAERMTLPLGRIRMAAQPLGVDLSLEDIDFSKYWDKKTKVVLEDKLIRITLDHLAKELNITREEWEERLLATPNTSTVCHGKDLVKAAQMFFRYLYKMDNKITPDILAMMMRLAVDQTLFESWSVVKRIRAWENRCGRKVLENAA
jgi:hypothetical protein